MHPDLEFAVRNVDDSAHHFTDAKEAKAFAIDVAVARGESVIDVLVWSADGARAYGGDDAVDRYYEDPEASVFERFEIKVNNAGRVP